MNNLSVLRGSYIQKMLNLDMKSITNVNQISENSIAELLDEELI